MIEMESEQEQKKKRRGRPPKAVKRQLISCIRFTKAEHFVACQKAEKAGLSLSDYLRKCAIHTTIKARLEDEDRHFFRHLTSLCNNLNQLTKLAHQQGLFSAMMHFEKELKQIDELLIRFKK